MMETEKFIYKDIYLVRDKSNEVVVPKSSNVKLIHSYNKPTEVLCKQCNETATFELVRSFVNSQCLICNAYEQLSNDQLSN